MDMNLNLDVTMESAGHTVVHHGPGKSGPASLPIDFDSVFNNHFSGEWCETSMYGNYGQAGRCKSNCDCINQVNHCVGPCTIFD